MNNQETLFQEAYFGKTKLLLECERTIDQMIQVYKQNQNVDMTNHPLNQKLQLLFKKQFGFKEVYINWYRTGMLLKDTFNACTYSSAFVIADTSLGKWSNLPTDVKNGYYDIRHENILAIEVSYLFAILGQHSAGEILAIILHEIGHNFEKSPYRYFSLLTRNIALVMAWLTLAGQTNWMLNNNYSETDAEIYFKNLKIIIQATVFGTKPYKFIMNWVNKITNKLLDVIPLASAIEHLGINFKRIRDSILELDPRMFIYHLVVVKSMMQANPLLLPAKWVSSIPTKKAEIFADSFAATYGYGPELATALEGLDTVTWNEAKMVLDHFPVLSFLSDFKVATIYLANTMFDPGHGTSIERQHKIMIHLREELQKPDIHPELRKKLLKDADDLDRILEAYQKKTKKEHMYITAAMQWFIMNICGGNSFLFEKIFPDFRA